MAVKVDVKRITAQFRSIQKSRINDCISDLRETLRPPEDIETSDWAEKYRFLPAEAAAIPGRWSNDPVPHLIEPMNVVNDPEIEELTLMWSAQMAKTECILNICLSRADINPGPMMFIQPTLSMAEAFSKDRIATTIRDTPRLRKIFGDEKSRNSGSTILHKPFIDGHLTITGANSPSSFVSRPIRDVYGDEFDQWVMDLGGQGDPGKIISKRTATFKDRLLAFTSTPTIKDFSKIEKRFKQSDQRYRHVKCPHCGKYQKLNFKNVKWDKDKETGEHLPDTAYYVCDHGGCIITEDEKFDMLQTGVWIATMPTRKHAGFHINELYSNFRTWGEVVEDFLAAKNDVHALKAFVNLSLGMPFEMAGHRPNWKRLYDRREDFEFGVVPEGVEMLTSGVDIQRDRIEVFIWGWRRDHQSYLVDHRVIEGDPTNPKDKTWKTLDKMIFADWVDYKGMKWKVAKWAVDSGKWTQTVYNFCRKYPGRVLAIKGYDSQSQIISNPKDAEVQIGKKKKKLGFKRYVVGTDMLKDLLYAFLMQEKPLDGEEYPGGFVHLPEVGEDICKQLCAEVKIENKTKKGFKWEKKGPNEAMDCWGYARAAASHEGMDRFNDRDWDNYVKSLHAVSKPRTDKRKRTEESIW